MMSGRAWMFVLLWLVQSTFHVHASSELQHCSASDTNNQVSVNVRRNQTGHWLTQVGLKNKRSSISDDELGWSADVSQRTSNCDGGRDSVLETIINLTAPPQRLRPDYELFPGVGYYKFHSNVETWQRAREVCVEEGTHLAIPNSEKEVAVYMQLFARHPTINNATWNDWLWVGIHEEGKDSEYVTVFGDPISSTGFFRWHPTGPHSNTLDDGVLMHRGTGALTDGSTAKCAFICEREF